MFTSREVTAYLNICERTLYRLMARGHIHGYKVGARWRFNKQEIDTYLARHKSTPIHA